MRQSCSLLFEIRRPTRDTPQDQAGANGCLSVTDSRRGQCGDGEFRLSPIADTIRNRLASIFTNEDVIALALCSLCQSRAASRESSQDRIHDTSEQNRAEDDRGNASHFEDGSCLGLNAMPVLWVIAA